MRKIIIGVVVLVVIGLIAFGIFGSRVTSAGQAAAQVTPTLPPIKASNDVIATASVEPVPNVELSMLTTGIVSQVPVNEGDHVTAGQLLVKLESSQQQAAVEQAQAALQKAQAAKQKLFQTPDENQVLSARADLMNADAALKQAQTAYDQAGGSGNPNAGVLPTSLALQQASNNYAAAKGHLDVLLEAPKPADVAEADADIASAQASLDQAKSALSNMELRAPFAGTVVTMTAKVGQQVTPGAVVAQVANLSSFEIKTYDLTELSIVRVHVGDPVKMTFDAIPDFQLGGKVAKVSSLGTNRQGDIVYTVTIVPDQMDPRLKWNMTAKVDIGASGAAQ